MALLADEPLKQRVKAMAARLQALDTPGLIAQELEKLVASRGG